MISYTPERWDLLSNLLGDVLQRPAGERDAFLDVACSGDERLRAEIGQLLQAYYQAEETERFTRGALDLVPQAFPQTSYPRHVGPYRLIEEVGHGGMGSVWMAERADGLFEQRVAVKMMRGAHLPDEYRRRFDAERRILAKLHHPNIARILDGGVAEDGQPYLVMEYVDALTITAYCRTHALSVDERLALFLTVCETVAYAHQNLVVHRDLKPSNILVTEAGDVKLLDFGIAKLLAGDESGEVGAVPMTRTGISLMTPEYAAPEQVTGDAVTTATDVYALGIVLFELLTGERPYRIDSRTPSTIEQVVCHTEPMRPSTAVLTRSSQPGGEPHPERLARRLRGDLDTIILKALRKEPGRRYLSSAQLADDVRRHLDGLPVEARPDTPAYRMRKFIRRHALGVAAGSVVVAALIVGLGVSIAQTRVADAARERADVVSAFLQEMLASPDPYADGPDVRVADVLDRAGEMLPTRFAGRPALEATLRKTLGTSYMELGMYQQAGQHLSRAIELLRRQPPGDMYVDAVAALGNLRKRMGEYHAADSLLSLAFERDHARYGAQHGRTALRFGDLGALRWEQGDYGAADSLLRQSLDLLELHDGPDSLRVAVALGHLATLWADQGRNAEAEALYRRSLALLRRAYGDRHPEIPQTLSHIGIIRDDLEDFEGAQALHTEALALFRELRGERHPDVAYALSNLASAEGHLGNYARADSLQQMAIAINVENLGETHPVIGILYNNVGSLRKQQGNVDGALQAYEKALATWRAGLPPDHPYLGYGLHNVGATLLSLGRIAEALPPLKEAYDLRAALLGPDNPERANTSSMYGEALARAGEVVRAEPLLVEAHAALQRAYGDGHSATQAAAERLQWFAGEFGIAADR